jgi:predicted small lipoprotein YifL
MKAMMLPVIIVSLVFLTLSACTANKPVEQPDQAPAAPAQTPVQTESNDVIHVRNVVNTRQVQLQNLYRRQAAVTPMQGTLQIKLFITDQGVVQNSDIIVDSGMLNTEFVTAVKQEVATWRFLIREPLIYTFKVQFKKA